MKKAVRNAFAVDMVMVEFKHCFAYIGDCKRGWSRF